MRQETKSLLRAVGRGSLAALMLNTSIGASIFGLPSLLAAQLGMFSPAGYLVTSVGIGGMGRDLLTRHDTAFLFIIMHKLLFIINHQRVGFWHSVLPTRGITR